MIKAIIFDAYGTLFDTKDGSIKASAAILEKNSVGIDPSVFYAKWKTYHKEHVLNLKDFLKESEIFLLDLKRLYNEYKIMGNVYEDVEIMLSTLGVRSAYPETKEVIDQLRTKHRVYIGSTSDSKPLEEDIKRNGIVVDGIFTSESLRIYKPNKEFYLRILEQIGASPLNTIYVGDSQIDDILGPKSIEIKSVWLNRKNEKLHDSIPKPDYEIKNLKQLIEIVDQYGDEDGSSYFR